MVGIWKRLFGRKREQGDCAAVVAAAGSSTRMEGTDKILLPLNEVPALLYGLRALENCPSVFEIIVVTREDLIVPVAQLCRDAGLVKVKKVVVGGQTRVESVLAGIREVSAEAQLIAIHDGARPLVTEEVIETAIAAARKTGSAAPAVPVKDTVKVVCGSVVERTLDRAVLRAVQTPQVFESGLIRAALTQALKDGAEVTDDCMAVERLGMSVTLTEGSDQNLKITTPADIALAEALLNGSEQR